MRKSFEKNGWPPVYVADITTWDGQLQTQRVSPLAFILPQENIFPIVEKNIVETLCQTEGATHSAKDHVE